MKLLSVALISASGLSYLRSRAISTRSRARCDSSASRARTARAAPPATHRPARLRLEGPCTLGDLFGGRSQLAIYHFILAPGSDHLCPGCSFTMDQADAARRHFEHADLAFAAVSRAPIEQIEAVKARMGWTFPWVSSDDGDFNYDFGVSFTVEDREAGCSGAVIPASIADYEIIPASRRGPQLRSAW